MRKRTTYTIISFLISAFLIFIWLEFIDLSKFRFYLRKVKIPWVILASALYLFSYFIRSLRWRILLKPIKKLKRLKVYFIWMLGNFLNYVVPIRAGELAKSYFLKKTDGIPIARSLPSVFIDKLFDSIAIFVVIGLIPFLNIEISKTMLFLIILLVTIFIAGVFILTFSAFNKKLTAKFMKRFLFWIPEKYKIKFFELIDLFVEGISIFKNHYNLLPRVSFLTILSIFTDSLYFWLMFLSFGETVFFPIILFGYTLINLSYIIPHPPAQIGSNEVIMVVIFSIGFGFQKEFVSAVMAFSHLLTGILIVSIGLTALSFLGMNLKESIKGLNKK